MSPARLTYARLNRFRRNERVRTHLGNEGVYFLMLLAGIIGLAVPATISGTAIGLALGKSSVWLQVFPWTLVVGGVSALYGTLRHSLTAHTFGLILLLGPVAIYMASLLLVPGQPLYPTALIFGSLFLLIACRLWRCVDQVQLIDADRRFDEEQTHGAP